MKTLLRIVLAIAALIVIVGIIAYADGSSLPVNHSVSVEGTVQAPPARVFAIITNVANGPAWRHDVKSVQVLPPEQDPSGPQDHWIEDLGHGVQMNFIALETKPLESPGVPAVPDEQKVIAIRKVRLRDPQYGGTWIYELRESRSNDGWPITILKITEDGYINPPIYRFVMAHVLRPTRNLDQYLKDIQAAAKK